MRWPFARRTTDAEVEPVAGAPAPPAPAWAALPPLQRTLTDRVPSTFKVGAEVTSDLIAVRSPRLTGPLGHLVSPLAPSGLIDGLVTPVQRRELTGGPALDLARPALGRSDAPSPARDVLVWEAPDAGRTAWHLPALEPAESGARPVDAPHPIDERRPLPVVSRAADTAPLDASQAVEDTEVGSPSSIEPEADAEVLPLEDRDAPELATLSSVTAPVVEEPRSVPGQGFPALPLSPPIQPLALQRRVVGTDAGTPSVGSSADARAAADARPAPAVPSAPPVGDLLAPVAPEVEVSPVGSVIPPARRQEQPSDEIALAGAAVPTLARMPLASAPPLPAVPGASGRQVELGDSDAQIPEAHEPVVPTELAREQPLMTHNFGLDDEPVEMGWRPLPAPAVVQRAAAPVGGGTQPVVHRDPMSNAGRLRPHADDGPRPSPAAPPLQRATLDLRVQPVPTDTTSTSARTNVTGSLASPPFGPAQVRSDASPPTTTAVAAPLLALPLRARPAPVVDGTPSTSERSGALPEESAPQAAVQRVPDVMGSLDESPLSASVAAPPTMQAVGIAAPSSAAGVVPGGDGDLDELAKKLYDRIRWRLRTELRLDLERAGRSAGLQR